MRSELPPSNVQYQSGYIRQVTTPTCQQNPRHPPDFLACFLIKAGYALQGHLPDCAHGHGAREYWYISLPLAGGALSGRRIIFRRCFILSLSYETAPAINFPADCLIFLMGKIYSRWCCQTSRSGAGYYINKGSGVVSTDIFQCQYSRCLPAPHTAKGYFGQ